VNVLSTDRLILRKLTTLDAAFILELVNEPSWLRYIGDRGVRTIEDARDYILKGPIDSYQRLGFGLYLVERTEGGIPLGMCGLIKRASLEDVDIGFAFVPSAWGHGYAREAASAVMELGKSAFGLNRLAAVTTEDNERSMRLLEKLGFRFERMVKLSPEEPELRLFARAL